MNCWSRELGAEPPLVFSFLGEKPKQRLFTVTYGAFEGKGFSLWEVSIRRHFTEQGFGGGVCGGAAVRSILDVFFKSSSLALVSEACLFMPGGAGFSVLSLSTLLSLMTSHLLAWKREFDLSENGDLLFPFCSVVLGHPHLVASGGCGLRQGRT